MEDYVTFGDASRLSVRTIDNLCLAQDAKSNAKIQLYEAGLRLVDVLMEQCINSTVKSINVPKKEWEQLETYLSENSEIDIQERISYVNSLFPKER